MKREKTVNGVVMIMGRIAMQHHTPAGQVRDDRHSHLVMMQYQSEVHMLFVSMKIFLVPVNYLPPISIENINRIRIDYECFLMMNFLPWKRIECRVVMDLDVHIGPQARLEPHLNNDLELIQDRVNIRVEMKKILILLSRLMTPLPLPVCIEFCGHLRTIPLKMSEFIHPLRIPGIKTNHVRKTVLQLAHCHEVKTTLNASVIVSKNKRLREEEITKLSTQKILHGRR